MSEPSAITGLPDPQRAVHAVGIPATPRSMVKPCFSRTPVRYFEVSTSWKPSSPKLKTWSVICCVMTRMPSTSATTSRFSVSRRPDGACAGQRRAREHRNSNNGNSSMHFQQPARSLLGVCSEHAPSTLREFQRVRRMSTSRSTKRHSGESRSAPTSSSNAPASAGVYSNQVRKSNGSSGPRSRQWCSRRAIAGR